MEARNGRPRTALRGFQDVIDRWYRGGDWANQWLSVRHVMGIFGEIGRPEDAAVVHGGLGTAGAAKALPFDEADAARLAASIEELCAELGDERFAAAVDRGAAMGDREPLPSCLTGSAPAWRDRERAPPATAELGGNLVGGRQQPLASSRRRRRLPARERNGRT